jgi:hypothetical protein
MDENHRKYDLKAPGPPGSGAPLRLPGHGSFPGIDDRLVEPEVTRDEIIGGVRVVSMPAEAPHATQNTELDYVLRAHVVPGYRAATDLLTRHDEESDFASDTCVYKDGVDPSTGGRYLEEIAFEVVSGQNERLVTEKAVRMHRRGVRRIFTIWLKTQRVCEWSPESRNWRLLDRSAQIEDPCLVTPVSVAALLDAALADNAVAEALIAKDNPVLQKREAAVRSEGRAEGWAEGRAEGQAEGRAAALLQVLDRRGIPVSDAQRQEILHCRDLDRLDRWLSRALLASAAEDVTSEP